MSLRHFRLITLMMFTCAFTSTVAQSPTSSLEPLSQFPRSTITILTPDGHQHAFEVWVADTEPRREQGLMKVKGLAANSGMLFIFDQPERVQMWMKNTLIPLDMLFIDANGRIDSIAANTSPMSLKIIDAKRPVLGVLEIAGGIAAKEGIKAGALIKHSAFTSLKQIN